MPQEGVRNEAGTRGGVESTLGMCIGGILGRSARAAHIATSPAAPPALATVPVSSGTKDDENSDSKSKQNRKATKKGSEDHRLNRCFDPTMQSVRTRRMVAQECRWSACGQGSPLRVCHYSGCEKTSRYDDRILEP